MKIVIVTVLLCFLTLNFCHQRPKNAPPLPVPVITPKIVRSIPHDTLAFTQGLLFNDGLLYESTGAPDNRRSELRAIRAQSGDAVKTIPVNNVFAEGLALRNGNLVQLTWREQVAFVYSFPGMQLKGTIHYEGEGWGLTTDSAGFIMSNGSDTLYFRNDAFKTVKQVPVRCNDKPLTNLNELEFARGKVYANVWYSDYIFEIDPRSGNVSRIIDCTRLVALDGSQNGNDVLNGIAYNGGAGTFYITGKDWGKIFEVSF